MSLKALRVDNVGSMLRPAALREATRDYAEGRVSDAQLAGERDKAVRAVIEHQDRIGFPVIVDGEFRRQSYQASFARVQGAEDWLGAFTPERLGRTRPDSAEVVRGSDPGHSDDFRAPARATLRLEHNVPLEEWTFAQAQTAKPVKITILGPDRVSTMHHLGHPDDVYEDADEFMADVVAVERDMISGLVQAGCRYVHIDEPGFTAYVDDPSLEVLRQRGEDPVANVQRSVAANNELIAGFPDDVVFGVHLCRGNRESQWHREGAYDAIAESVLGGLRYDRLMLEYDSDRAGGFEPLRFARDDAVVVLGLLTTKTGEMESADEVKRRIEEASAFVPIERLALSTQCGFASLMSGNVISEEAQWRKLELVLSIAQDVWGAIKEMKP